MTENDTKKEDFKEDFKEKTKNMAQIAIQALRITLLSPAVPTVARYRLCPTMW